MQTIEAISLQRRRYYYNVDVIKVNIAKVPGKRHRRAKGISQDPDMRKAIVKIKAGQKIELLPR